MRKLREAPLVDIESHYYFSDSCKLDEIITNIWMFKNIYYMYYSLIKINGSAKLSTFIKYLKKMESVVSI